MQNYVYPKGDFLSGFSETQEPCEYELACQNLVIRGMQYLDANPEKVSALLMAKASFDTNITEICDYMTADSNSYSGMQVSQAIIHLRQIKKMGWTWEQYIQELLNAESDK